MISFLLLILGLVLVIIGANYLIDAVISLSRRFSIPAIILSLTLVSFGTSLPELVVSIVASVSGYNTIVFGNVVGSNIFNVLLILGVGALIYPIRVSKRTLTYDIPICIFVSFLIAVFVLFQKTQNIIITRVHGILLLLLFIIFIRYVFMRLKRNNENTVSIEDKKQYSLFVSIVLFVVGLVLLIGGGELIVRGAVSLAEFLNISSRIIAILIISVGTSFPELAVSVAAAIRKHHDIAVGNIIGSNVFNICLILGLSALIRPIEVEREALLDIETHIISVVLLFIVVLLSRSYKITRISGAVFLIAITTYITMLLLNYPSLIMIYL